ncbi:hypothetical protein HHI36_007299 [Cryptolaemus montrouzieri]|uniref:Zonadhesin n=1 Tax=Cryptolaemus montrouzieri TaxID=559131 RepID=A0ABD2MP83_9CUCU
MIVLILLYSSNIFCGISINIFRDVQFFFVRHIVVFDKFRRIISTRRPFFTTTESTQPPVINIIGSNEDKSLEDLSKDDILQLLSVWIPKLNATTKNSTPVAESTEEPCDITETSITHSGGSYVTKESSGSTITSAKETYVTAPSIGITYDISGTSNEIQYSSTGFTEELCDTTETEDLGVTVDAKLSTVIINNSEEPLGHKEIKSSTDANKDSVIDFVSLWMEKLKTTTYAPSVVTLLSAEPHDATKISSVTSTLKEEPDYITKTSIKSTRSTEYVTSNPVITDHKSEEIETTTTSTGKPYIITNTPTRTLEPTFTTTTKSCQEPCDTTDSKNLNIHNPQSSTATNYDSEEPSGSSENENSTDISKDDVLDFLSIWMSKLKTTTKSPIIITEPYGTTKTSIEGTKPFIPTESLIHDTETTSSKPTKYVNTNYPPLTISSEELNDTENLFEITTTSSTRTKTTYEPNSAKDIFSITTQSCEEPCDTKTTDSINFITDNSQLSTAKINHDSEEPFEPSSTDINEDNILDFLSVWLAKLQTTTQPPIIITELSENPYDTTNISTMKTKLTEEIVTSITESIEESRDTIITQSPEEKVGTNDAIITTISKQFYDTSKIQLPQVKNQKKSKILSLHQRNCVMNHVILQVLLLLIILS